MKIFYFPLPTPSTRKGRFPPLNSSVFAAFAVKRRTSKRMNCLNSISSTASHARHAVHVACFIFGKLKCFWGQGLVGIGVASLATMLTNLLPDILNVVITPCFRHDLTDLTNRSYQSFSFTQWPRYFSMSGTDKDSVPGRICFFLFLGSITK
jgi:hypothetical protein